MTSTHWLQAQQTTIIFVGDPMCSWCYGFTNEITEVKNNHEEIDFQMVMGGLRPFNTQKITELSSFLREHWEEIHSRTGQKFSYGILENEEFIYDTEPAARAVVVARKMMPEITFQFFKAVQTAFYAENKNTLQLDTYLEIAKRFKLDEQRFSELFESEEVKAETKQDFALSQQMGVRGFPTVILKKGDDLFMIANGYVKAEYLEKRIEKLLK